MRKYVKVIGRSFLFELQAKFHFVTVATSEGAPTEIMDFC